MIRCRRYLVAGRVQGVGFRYFVHRAALELGVKGRVRNLRDGRVECCAEAATGVLDRLEQRLREGPRWSHVESVETEDLELRRWTRFLIEV